MDQVKLEWLRSIGLIVETNSPAARTEVTSHEDTDGNVVIDIGGPAPVSAGPDEGGGPQDNPLEDPLDSVIPPTGQGSLPGAGFPTGAAVCRYDKASDSVHIQIATYGGLGG